ncbi:MAG: hypothetical protein IKS18_12135 [Lachnospiraceae bacterium]|nr:hypothetical protein [Lachnospiraceae bacterium]
MKLVLPEIFGEGMVLQRGKRIPVWGKSVKNDHITAVLGDCVLETDCGDDGRFRMDFPPQEACEKTGLFVTSSVTGEKISFIDVAIGEVFLCGGQSNMEFLLKYDVGAETEYAAPDDPDLRMFTCPQINFDAAENLTDVSEVGYWRRFTNREDRGMFGAISAYMGKILRKELGVPVGMIGCNWGGTPAAAWASLQEIQNTPAMQPILEWYDKTLTELDWRPYFEASEKPVPPTPPEMKARMDRFMMGEGLREFMEMMAKNPAPMPMPVYSAYVPGPRACIRPAGLYDTMLKKVAPYALAGFIWYQGEDDDFRDWQEFYGESMKAVIRSWRTLFEEELPFYQVDLAPFMGRGATGAKKYPLMRELQHESSKEMLNAKDVCIMDLGDEINIHFRDKRKAGERLANLALRYLYGKDIKADSPEFDRAERDQDRLLLHFRDAGDGLLIDRSVGDTENALVVTADGKPVEPKISAGGDMLILSDPSFTDAEKITVSYAEQNYCRGFLFDSTGLPAFPFHTIAD